MIQAASEASKFYEEVVASRTVFTLLDEGDFLLFMINGLEVVPFWSTESRIAVVQKNHPRYRRFACDKIELEAFLERTLPELQVEGIHIGVNWSGTRLTGYDISVPDLVQNLSYWQARTKQ